ncbi:TlpA family protein disulfide reductase [Sphingobacterium sp. SG20118]|uniref:TlpA family protein disulfide reductase n=1 Tax=Sphingobacterium sp. SG20118 TaxID=3367156 RepID=UPI0037DFC1AF
MKYLRYILYFFPIVLFAQERLVEINSKTIHIGMQAPIDAIGLTANGKQIGVLKEFPEELIILDFMNTSCTSCIAALPLLNKLQQENKGRLKIISISNEKKDRVEGFSRNNDVFKANKLDYVVEDTVWGKFFPHQTVSHMVWIFKGIVIAITFAEFVNQTMIDKVLAGGRLDLPIKDDFLVYDYTVPLIKNQIGYFSFLTGYLEEAYTRFGQEADSTHHFVREYIVNAGIVAAFLYCYSKISALPYMKDSRIIVERSDKKRFVFDNEQSGYLEIWKRRYGMSYEANFDMHTNEQDRAHAMIADMELKLGIKTAIESRSVKCWVVKDAVQQKGQLNEEGQTIADFAFMLDLNSERPPVVNESINNNKYRFVGFSDFKELQHNLRDLGFLLVEEDRQIPCFILK